MPALTQHRNVALMFLRYYIERMGTLRKYCEIVQNCFRDVAEIDTSSADIFPSNIDER